MKVYLSGPVTGLENNNREQFEYFSSLLESVGFETIIPTKMVSEGTDWHCAMRTCIAAMMKADLLVMLQGWPHSKGATIEHRIAKELDIPVLYAEKV